MNVKILHKDKNKIMMESLDVLKIEEKEEKIILITREMNKTLNVRDGFFLNSILIVKMTEDLEETKEIKKESGVRTLLIQERKKELEEIKNERSKNKS